MAGEVTEVQGTKAYLVATGTAVSNATEIAAAIAGGEQILCLLELGDISLGARAVQEYTCISSDESFKSLGSVSLANITPELLYNAADVAGQADLRDMWDNSTRRIMIVEFDDQITPTTGNPSYITFEAAISEPTIGVAKDNAVMYNPTIEICTKPDATVIAT